MGRALENFGDYIEENLRNLGVSRIVKLWIFIEKMYPSNEQNQAYRRDDYVFYRKDSGSPTKFETFSDGGLGQPALPKLGLLL